MSAADEVAVQRERNYLIASATGNLVVAVVGLIVSTISSSQAILLDGLFNLTYFATGLFTIRVARLVAGGDDARYPHGYAFFEPLVNGIKGMLVLGVSLVAFVGAVQTLWAGGSSIQAGVAIAYGVFASAVCWTIAWITWKGAKETHSPLVKADAENWMVNAAISSCVLLAFGGIFLLNAIGLEGLAPFVDPIVVLAVVGLSIGVPVRMARQALLELLNRAPAEEIVKQVEGIIDEELKTLPVQERFVRVIQPGRLRIVLAHIVLPEDFQVDSLKTLDGLRLSVQHSLQRAHVATLADVLFTADRRWGAPVAESFPPVDETPPSE